MTFTFFDALVALLFPLLVGSAVGVMLYALFYRGEE